MGIYSQNSSTNGKVDDDVFELMFTLMSDFRNTGQFDNAEDAFTALLEMSVNAGDRERIQQLAEFYSVGEDACLECGVTADVYIEINDRPFQACAKDAVTLVNQQIAQFGY